MQITPMRGPGTTILVVDDDALITLNMVDVLKEQGLVAIDAYSGPEALAIFQQRSDIGALLTDYSMPGMTGVELADAVRLMRPDLPVLLTSGYSELPVDSRCDYQHLEKPFREEDLIQRIDELLTAAAD